MIRQGSDHFLIVHLSDLLIRVSLPCYIGHMRTPIALLAVIPLLSTAVRGQETHHDTTFKNVARFNLTPLVINGLGNYVVGYERLLSDRRSFSVNTGLLALPELLPVSDSATYDWKNTIHNRGFSFAADYRHYFTRRNRFAIPDGLYWGPYVTYYYFDNRTGIQITPEGVPEQAELQTYVNMLMIGAELGYQLVLHDRWTVDMILAGPSVGFYSLDMSLSASANVDNDDPYIQGAYDALVKMFPGLSKLINDEELRANGTGSTWGMGFRYVFQVGYRF